MASEEKEYITTEVIENFLFSVLIENGYVPETEEVEVIADAFFELMIKLGFIDEIDEV